MANEARGPREYHARADLPADFDRRVPTERDPREITPEDIRKAEGVLATYDGSWEEWCDGTLPEVMQQDFTEQAQHILTGFRDALIARLDAADPLRQPGGEVEKLRGALEEALSLIGHRIFCGRCEEYEPQCGCTPSAAEIRRAVIRRDLEREEEE